MIDICGTVHWTRVLTNFNKFFSKRTVIVHEAWTYRSLYEHGPLVAHLLHDGEGHHRLVGLDQAHGRLHGNQHPRTPDTSTATRTRMWIPWDNVIQLYLHLYFHCFNILYRTNEVHSSMNTVSLITAQRYRHQYVNTMG